MAAAVRLCFIILVLLPVTLVLAPLQCLLVWLAPKRAGAIPLFWHRWVLRLIGVRVHLSGKMADQRPLMLVANHVSWADIMVLGSIGELCFIAKDEVRGWPGINALALMQRTVFIDRDRQREAGRQANSIAARLIDGDVMVLFAEGTTGGGNQLLPFKSALFGAAQAAIQRAGLREIHVQPVALAYNTLHDMPLGRYHQSLAAWPGELTLFPHLKQFLLEGAFDVDVAFGPALVFTPETRRKPFAREVESEIRGLFARLRRLHHR